MIRSRSLWTFLLALCVVRPVMAREIKGSSLDERSNPDAWSVFGTSSTCRSGGNVTGCEVAVDATGNLVPTVARAQTLGSASLTWSNIEVSTINAGATNLVLGTAASAVTAAGTQSLGTAGVGNSLGTGNTSGPTNLTLAGGLVLAKSQAAPSAGGLAGQGLYVSSTIAVTTPYIVLISSGGNITLTSTPTISTTTILNGAVNLTDGMQIVVTSTATQSINLQDNDTLSGSLLELGAATRAISAKKALWLMFVQPLGKWIEIDYANN